MVKVDANATVIAAYNLIQGEEKKEGQLLTSKVKVIEKGKSAKTFEKGKATYAERHTKIAKFLETLGKIFNLKLARTDEVSVANGLFEFGKKHKELTADSKQKILDMVQKIADESPEKKEQIEGILEKFKDIKFSGWQGPGKSGKETEQTREAGKPRPKSATAAGAEKTTTEGVEGKARRKSAPPPAPRGAEELPPPSFGPPPPPPGASETSEVPPPPPPRED